MVQDVLAASLADNALVQDLEEVDEELEAMEREVREGWDKEEEKEEPEETEARLAELGQVLVVSRYKGLAYSMLTTILHLATD